MRALALAALLSGCATTWIATQATGTQAAWEEGARDVSVPQPGVHERLNVMLPLATQYTGASASTVAEPFALQCSVDQRGRDVVYHSAFRYGSRWKLMSGLMALAEGGLATAFLLGRDEKPQYIVYGGFFAVDALVTSALFFIPRKEIYKKSEEPRQIHVRSDCPDGMTLEIGAEHFPVDAAGRIGDVGDAALDAWMGAPNGPLVVDIAGQSRYFEIGQGEQCVWLRDHHPQQATCFASVALRSVLVSIEVPAGTLTTIAAP